MVAQPFDVHPNQIKPWKAHLLASVPEVFDGAVKQAAVSEIDVTALHAKIGQLTLERFFRGGAQEGRSIAERKTMIDRAHRLSVSRQAKLLGISRGSVYSQRRPSSTADLALIHRMEALHVEYPFTGSRMLRGLLRQEGSSVGRLHVATLMKRMGIAALYRRPTTSHSTPGRQIYPSRLRKLAVARPNQVSAMAITSVPMARGFVYLVAVVDGFSRKVLAWRLSMTLETGPGLEALSEARAGYGPPEILNTDQGRQFTSVASLTALQDAKIAISMDGKGAGHDNVFIERLWRTITDEAVSRRASRSASEARGGLDRYLAFYNRRRPHSSLGGQTPDQAYFNQPTPIPAAA